MSSMNWFGDYSIMELQPITVEFFFYETMVLNGTFKGN